MDSTSTTAPTSRRALRGWLAPVGRGDLLLAGEVKSYDGPWALDEHIRKLNGVAR